MFHVKGLQCVLCEAEYGVEETQYTCPQHGMEGILDVIYDYDAIGRRFTKERLARNRDYSIWRYLDLLPISRPDLAPPLQIGWSPLYHAQRLGAQLGLANLYIKDDGRNPTGSLKDRASAIGIVKARERGQEIITAASTGNAASSLAGLAASVGIKTVIFVPETTPQPKIAQLLIYGAHVILVRGTYDQAFDLCFAASQRYGWYNRSTACNPYLSEGKKTAVLEICEQLGWEVPDKIFVSVGDGCIIGALAKGLRDLQKLGVVDRLPQLIGVQAEGSAVLTKAWASGTERIAPCLPSTLADSISVGQPRDAIKALRAVRRTAGEFITVSDEEILNAMRVMARGSGVFGEPAGATGFAGLLKMQRENRLDPAERIVVLVTGNGLKDVDSAIQATKAPPLIEPTVRALARQVEESGLVSRGRPRQRLE